MNTLILCGSRSVEHEVSVITALQVYENLDANAKKYFIYITKSNEFIYVKEPSVDEIDKIHKNKNIRSNIRFIKNGIKYKRHDININVCIPVIHGGIGENGTIFGLLKMYSIPYIGLDEVPAAITIDKVTTKQLLKYHGIRTSNFYYINNKEDILREGFTYPVIVKPSSLGSSVGITVCNSTTEFTEAVDIALSYDDKVIIEEYLENARELNISIMGIKDDYIVSNIEEVLPTSKYLTYDDKYQSKSNANRLIKEIILEDYVKNEIVDAANKVFTLFNLSGVVRIDLLYANGLIYVNEINTVPGSLSYYLYDHSFNEHLNLLIKYAYRKYEFNSKLITKYRDNLLNPKLNLKK